MDYQVANAYPALSLHDCQISKLEIIDGSMVFTFDEGYRIDAEVKTKPHAKIIIPEDISGNIRIVKSKMVRFIKGVDPIFISREISFQKFQKLIEKKEVIIIDEYYDSNSLFWRGIIQVQEKRKRKWYRTVGYFEVSIYLEDNIVYKYSV